MKAQSGGGSCSTDLDCWLNGDCINNQCACDPVWMGANCNTLFEQPSVQLWPSPQYPLPSNVTEYTDSWGVTIGLDEATGVYHMIACVACVWNFTSNDNYTTFSMHNSMIIEATSAVLEGPYYDPAILEFEFSEGPHMSRTVDGGFILTSKGNTNRSVVPGVPYCTGDFRPSSPSQNIVFADQLDAKRRSSMLPTSKLLSGGPNLFYTSNLGGKNADKWTLYEPSISHLGSYTYNSNPSFFIDKETSVSYLAFRTQPGASLASGETIAFASAPFFNYSVYTSIAEPIIPALVNHEDPFLWKHSRGYSILTHAMVGSAPNAPVGGLFVSKDGITWLHSPVPAYTTFLNMTGLNWNTNGTIVPLDCSRRERPELLFYGPNNTISHLLTGCLVGRNNVWPQLSYSMMTPLGPQ
jgi:EGF-like domain